jgi:hypothetical protein
VAKLCGQLLGDLGLLLKGNVVIKTSSDLIGEYIGRTEAYTTRICTATMGKLLIIDEAHMLHPSKRSGDNKGSNIYRLAAIATIVALAENKEGRCIILVDYTEPMVKCFIKPTLVARRFHMDDPAEFTDFNVDQLTQILDKKLRDQELAMAAIARNAAIQMLQLARDCPSFANGREVENMIEHAKATYQKRLLLGDSRDPSTTVALRPEDLDTNFD